MTSVSQSVTPSQIDRDEWLRLARMAKLLSWLSLIFIGTEGIVALIAGIIASSIALIGFGIDSAIEGLASLIIIWRFTGSRLHSEHAELRAQRLVAIQFFLLAPYIAVEAVRDLWTGHEPLVSWVGIGISVFSLISMPLLGRAKQRIGTKMGSVATQGEGAQNILCAYMAATLLVGLLGNALFGWWWLDPAAALLIAGIAVREGINSWRGDSCCIPVASDAIPGTHAHGHDHDCC